jgi:hypothetical protein
VTDPQTQTTWHCMKCDPPNPLGARMHVCETCGNRRCPRASDHEYACTGGNEPGQKGSVYASSTNDAAVFFGPACCDALHSAAA